MTDDAAPPPDAPKPRRGRVVAMARPAPPVSAEAVDLLRRLLSAAEAGEIAEVVCITATHDGATGWERTEVTYVSAVLGELWRAGNTLSEDAE